MGSHYGGWEPPKPEAQAPAPPVPTEATAQPAPGQEAEKGGETVTQPSPEAQARAKRDEVQAEYTSWLQAAPQRLAAFATQEAQQAGLYIGAIRAFDQMIEAAAPTPQEGH